MAKGPTHKNFSSIPQRHSSPAPIPKSRLHCRKTRDDPGHPLHVPPEYPHPALPLLRPLILILLNLRQHLPLRLRQVIRRHGCTLQQPTIPPDHPTLTLTAHQLLPLPRRSHHGHETARRGVRGRRRGLLGRRDGRVALGDVAEPGGAVREVRVPGELLLLAVLVGVLGCQGWGGGLVGRCMG